MSNSLKSNEVMDESEPIKVEPAGLTLLGFALGDCVVEIDRASVKYLRAVHRTALELATPNCFGAEIGGFWLLADQIAQLNRLPDYYQNEGSLVTRAVKAYLNAQRGDFISNWGGTVNAFPPKR